MKRLAVALAGILVGALASGCDRANSDVRQTPATERATRRAYDGAPPAIPHAPFGAACLSCHGNETMKVAGIGVAPRSPHGDAMKGALQRCVQCHVYRTTDAVFRTSTFAGVPQDLAAGDRLYDGAPPRIPHPVFMREQCATCHAGETARQEILCSHPERVLCTQCHVPATIDGEFVRTER